LQAYNEPCGTVSALPLLARRHSLVIAVAAAIDERQKTSTFP
jgi:hypothetical protein